MVRYEFDAAGLRTLGQGEGEIRILCVGDSFTFGWMLSDSDTFLSQLQRMADEEFGDGRFVLLNGGHGGWGTSDYVRFFEEYGSDIQPSGLIVFLNTDDLGRSVRNPKYELVNSEALRLQKVTRLKRDGLSKRVANAVPGYRWLLEHSHLVQLARNAVVSVRSRARDRSRGGPDADAPKDVPSLQSPAGEDPEKARILGRALFRRLKGLADERSVGLLVLTTGFHRTSSADDHEPTRAFMLNARQTFMDEGIAFYDCSEDLRTRIGNDYSSVTMVRDGHPNEDGARLIAELNWPQVRTFLAEIDRTASSDGRKDVSVDP